MKTLVLLFILLSQSSQASTCSNVDVRDNMSDEMSRFFSEPREQGQIGWCYAFAAADLMSAEEGVPLSSTHTSIEFNKKVQKNPFLNIGYKIKSFFEKDKFNEVHQGGFIGMAINQAENKKICKEKSLPYGYLHSSQVKSLIRQIETIKMNLKEGNVSFKNACEQLSTMFTTTFDTNFSIPFMEIIYDMQEDNLNLILAKIADHACRGEHAIQTKEYKVKKIKKPVRRKGPRFKLSPAQYKKKKKEYFEKIAEIMKKGKPVGISYNTKHIAKFGGFHASSITGRRLKDGKCQFKIRNSWGEKCEYYKKGVPCDREEGAFWVDEDTLYGMSMDLSYIE